MQIQLHPNLLLSRNAGSKLSLFIDLIEIGTLFSKEVNQFTCLPTWYIDIFNKYFLHDLYLAPFQVLGKCYDPSSQKFPPS